jgi:hypothetical protein
VSVADFKRIKAGQHFGEGQVKGEDLPHLILAWRHAHPMRAMKPFARHITPDETVYMELGRMTITAA